MKKVYLNDQFLGETDDVDETIEYWEERSASVYTDIDGNVVIYTRTLRC